VSNQERLDFAHLTPNRRVVARVDVIENRVPHKLTAVFAVQVESVHGVVDVEGEFEGRRCGAEESVKEDEGFRVIDAAVVYPFDDDFCCAFVDAGAQEELSGLEAAFGWEPEVIARVGCGAFAVLFWVEETVGGAGEEGEFGLVGYPAEVNLVGAVVVDGVDVDCAGGRCCAGGDCFVVFHAGYDF
jgi:hypothetical protein